MLQIQELGAGWAKIPEMGEPQKWWSFARREFCDYDYGQKVKIYPLVVAADIQNKLA